MGSRKKNWLHSHLVVGARDLAPAESAFRPLSAPACVVWKVTWINVAAATPCRPIGHAIHEVLISVLFGELDMGSKILTICYNIKPLSLHGGSAIPTNAPSGGFQMVQKQVHGLDKLLQAFKNWFQCLRV
jgi:hypothetical protein